MNGMRRLNEIGEGLKEVDRARLILSGNRAMISQITKNIREIDVEYIEEENKIIVYVFYDSQPNDHAGKAILLKMIPDFPEVAKWENRAIVIPSNEWLPKIDICLYRRYEYWPDQ